MSRNLDARKAVPMTCHHFSIVAAICLLGLAGCSKKEESAELQKQQASAPATPATAAQPASSTAAAEAAKTEPAPAATPAEPTPAAAPVPAAPPPPKTWTIPAGTTLSVRTLDGMSTKNAKSGSEFDATLSAPLVVDGETLAKAGSSAVGKVVGSSEGGRVKGKALLTLSLARIRLNDGQTISVQTNSVSQEAKSGTKKNLARTGIMAGAGAAIGAIAGGGKGAAIGAGIGGGAGVATNMATRGPAAEVPAEAQLTFQLANSVTVTERKKK